MNKIDRIKATLKGKEVDRPAISFWRHFYKQETTAQGLAEAMLGFQKKYDWDFLKVNARAEYHVEDWGSIYEYSGDDYIKPRLKQSGIKEAEDWKNLEVLPPDQGVLGEHLKTLELISKGLNGKVFFVMTIFTPLSVALKLVDDAGKLVQFINEAPGALHQGLEVITQTFAEFSKACLEAGARGIFFATTQCASTDLLSTAQYDEFGRKYDLNVLSAVKHAEFNILHVCKSNNMLYHLLDYPVQAFNWDAADASNPSLGEISKHTDKVVIGGVDHVNSLSAGSPEMVVKEARQAFNETGGRKWILGGGCTFSPQASEKNLMAARKAFDQRD